MKLLVWLSILLCLFACHFNGEFLFLYTLKFNSLMKATVYVLQLKFSSSVQYKHAEL